ncbi:ATP-binding protein [Nocardioides sp. GXQ0305]|uniref:ATP-binding protein n=1 Tax=Nocardioides sp. GXQ0305 TaxID=3423912 RepID=UPI003D7F163C
MDPTAGTGVGRAPGRPASRTLVGRDDVLRRLTSLVDGVVESGRLTPALLEGPAGIGKTRVVSELAVRVEGRADVLVGHCVDAGDQTLPYAPLVEVLTELVRREGVATVRGWAGPAGVELGRLVPSLHEDASTGSAGAGRLFQAVSGVLDGLAARGPVVLVLEDVHWMDASTRELVAALGRQQAGAILMLLTLRSDEAPVPAGLGRFVAELVRAGDQHLGLDPLSRDEQAVQVSDILGLPPTRRLLDEVWSRAEGNPFFAEELLALGPTEQRELPATVRGLLLARLDSLSPATRQVLRTASLVGREVPDALLEAVSDVHAQRLESALREAVEAHVLEPRGDVLAFRHALLQEAVAASLLPGEAARTHRRLAEALTETPALAGAGPGGTAGRIARHRDAAGDTERALVARVDAAREAFDGLAFAEALVHYDRALVLLDQVPDGESLLGVPRARLLRWAAEVAHLAADPDRATALVREAIVATDPADLHALGWLHERLGRYLWMAGDGRGALAAYEQAVALVPPEPPTRARAAVLGGLSQVLMLAARCAESEQLAREAIAVARQVPDGRPIEGHARCNLGVDLAMSGRFDEAIAELREARRIADEEFADVDENARALVNLHSALVVAGRLEEAADVARESVRVGDELGLRRRKGIWCRCDAAEVLVHMGRFDEAEPFLEECRELDPHGIDAVRADLCEGQLRLGRGAVGEARELLERARSEGDRILDPQLVAPLHAALLEVAHWSGDRQAAEPLVAEVLRRLDPTQVASFQAAVASSVTRAAAADGSTQDVGPWVEQVRVTLEGLPAVLPLAAADLATADAEMSGDPEAWALAAAAWERFGDPYHTSYARLRWAEALLATGGPRESAADQLRLAVMSAHRIGARHLAEHGAGLGRRARLSVDIEEPADNRYRLTAREREVLGLVALGLTDRAIGGRLFISHRTVERHVSNLLAKLDAGRRSELVATAHREGLVPTPASAGGEG